MNHAILLISCPDSKGITAAVTGFIAHHGGNIIHADQHIDEHSNTFFMRIEWSLEGFGIKREKVEAMTKGGFGFPSRVKSPGSCVERLNFEEQTELAGLTTEQSSPTDRPENKEARPGPPRFSKPDDIGHALTACAGFQVRLGALTTSPFLMARVDTRR